MKVEMKLTSAGKVLNSPDFSGSSRGSWSLGFNNEFRDFVHVSVFEVRRGMCQWWSAGVGSP